MVASKKRVEGLFGNVQKRAREAWTAPQSFINDAKKRITASKPTPAEIRKSLDGWLGRMKKMPVVEHLRQGDAKGVLKDAHAGLGRTFDVSVNKVMNVLQVAHAKDVARMQNDFQKLHKRVEDLSRQIKQNDGA